MWKTLWIASFLVFGFTTQVFCAVNASVETVEGVKVSIVRVDLDDAVKLRVAKGNGELVGAQPIQAMVAAHAPLAAINANYFDAYKTLEPMATIIQGGNLLQMVGHTASLMVFEDRKVALRDVTLKYFGSLDGKKKNEWNLAADRMDFNIFSVWYVNTPPTDPSGVYVYTAARNRAIFLQGGTVIEVIGGVVGRRYNPSGNIQIPSGGYVLYYGPSSATEQYITDRFRPGRTVTLTRIDQNDSATFLYKGQQISYDAVQEMIAAGPMVVEGGKNVAAERIKAYREAKIHTATAQRSAIGVTAEGKLILVTCVSDMIRLGNIMRTLGCTEAMNLDGGASSALYANGTYLKTPGRSLNTILMVQSSK